MNRLLAGTLLLAVTALGRAQTQHIAAGATVYIEPMGGYESYLAAAFTKKEVPLVIVTDRAKAAYVITSSVSQSGSSQAAVVVNNTTNVGSNSGGAFNQGMSAGYPHPAIGSTSASMSIVDVRSSQVVFAYSVGKARNNQLQSAAEACAKHLKEFIEKPPKK